MPTPRETILAALHARLSALPATVRRNEVLPEKVPEAGLVILRDGDPGEPDITLNPRPAFYNHRVELELFVTQPTAGGETDTLILPAHFPTPTAGTVARRGAGFDYRSCAVL
jgi:hypothetical protein